MKGFKIKTKQRQKLLSSKTLCLYNNHNSQVAMLASCHETRKTFPFLLVISTCYSCRFFTTILPYLREVHLWVSELSRYITIIQRCQLRLRIFWGHFGSGAWRRVQNSRLKLAYTLTTKAWMITVWAPMPRDRYINNLLWISQSYVDNIRGGLQQVL